MVAFVLSSSSLTAIILALGATATAVVVLGKALGLIPDRSATQEPRAEEMWRSEAEAQTARADRLTGEIEDLRKTQEGMRAEMRGLREEIVALRAQNQVLMDRPDFAAVLDRFDQHHREMVATGTIFADMLAEIATAVIPPAVILDEG